MATAAEEKTTTESPKPSVASEFVERLLVGAVESVVRAGAKALESVASDAVKALTNEAKKISKLQSGVKSWRKERLGEIVEIDVEAKVVDDETQ